MQNNIPWVFLRRFAASLLVVAVCGQTAWADDFWSFTFTGTAGAKPAGWYDNTDDSNFHTIIFNSYSGSYGAVSTVAGNSWGKVLSWNQAVDVVTYSKLEVVVQSVSGGGDIKVGVFKPDPGYAEYFGTPISSPGTYTFDIPTITGWSSSTTMGIIIVTEGSAESAEIASIRIYSPPTPTYTPTWTETPTITPTPTVTETVTEGPAGSPTNTPTPTATSSCTPTFTFTFTPTSTNTPTDDAFYDHFTSGSEGSLPTGWRDSTSNATYVATMLRSGTTLAEIQTTNYGKVLSPIVSSADLDSYRELQICVTSITAGTVFQLGIQEESGSYEYYTVASNLSATGTYTYQLPAGLTGTKAISYDIRFLSQTGSMTVDWVRLGLAANPTTTPTFTPTATLTPTSAVGTLTSTPTPSSEMFFDHFTDGSEGSLPPGWRDYNSNSEWGATIIRSGTSEAVIKGNTYTAYGKVLSKVLTGFDTSANPELAINVTSVDAGTYCSLWVQEEVAPWTATQIAGNISAPGLYIYSLPVTGTKTMSIDIHVYNTVPTAGSLKVDYIRVGTLSTPTVTPTATATPVPNVFRPGKNLFRPKDGPLQLFYGVTDAGGLKITVYNIAGQRVRVLVDSSINQPGSGTVTWDGTNDSGNKVASGVYIIRFEGNGFDKNIRVGLVK